MKLTFQQFTQHEYKNYLVIFLCFVITFNTPLSYLTMFLILLFFIFEDGLIARFKLLIKTGLAWTLLALFALHFVGLLWTESYPEGLKILSKQKIYIFAAILISFVDRHTARIAILALMSAILISEVYSLYLYFFEKNITNASQLSPFMHHMHYSLILTFTFGYIVSKLDTANIYTKKNRFLIIFATLTLITLFINIGRIGQLALPAVLMVLAVVKFNLSLKKSFIIVTTLIALLIVVTYNFNSQFKGRIDKTVYEFTETVGTGKRASIACRFEMWEYAINLGSKNPFIGIGTGDSILEMKKMLGESELKALYKECNLGIKYQLNPHNNFFLFYMQFGILGIALLIAILITQLRIACRQKNAPMLLLLTVTTIGMLTTSPISMHVKYMFFYSIMTVMLYIDSPRPQQDPL